MQMLSCQAPKTNFICFQSQKIIEKGAYYVYIKENAIHGNLHSLHINLQAKHEISLVVKQLGGKKLFCLQFILSTAIVYGGCLYLSWIISNYLTWGPALRTQYCIKDSCIFYTFEWAQCRILEKGRLKPS